METGCCRWPRLAFWSCGISGASSRTAAVAAPLTMWCRHRSPRSATGRAGCRESGRGLDDAQRIDLIRALEELGCAAAGAQAEVTSDFVLSQREAAASRGVPAARRDRGVAAQIAFAKRESHARGQRDVGLAMALRTELTCTREALRQGRITEWKATLLARETACLSLEHRQLVDEALAGDPDKIEAMGDRRARRGLSGSRRPVRPRRGGRAATPRGGRPAHESAAGAGHDDLARRPAAGQGRRRSAQGAAR